MRWQDARWRAGRLLLLHRLQEALCEANGFNLECHGVNVDVTAASSHSQHAEHLHVQVATSKSGWRWTELLSCVPGCFGKNIWGRGGAACGDLDTTCLPLPALSLDQRAGRSP